LSPHAATKVDFGNDSRVPLLIIGGGSDHIVPPSVSRSAAAHYNGAALIRYRGYSGRSHYTVGQDGWEEVADYALSWAVEHATTRPVVMQ
jgi:hypothetical protein